MVNSAKSTRDSGLFNYRQEAVWYKKEFIYICNPDERIKAKRFWAYALVESIENKSFFACLFYCFHFLLLSFLHVYINSSPKLEFFGFPLFLFNSFWINFTFLPPFCIFYVTDTFLEIGSTFISKCIDDVIRKW